MDSVSLFFVCLFVFASEAILVCARLVELLIRETTTSLQKPYKEGYI